MPRCVDKSSVFRRACSAPLAAVVASFTSGRSNCIAAAHRTQVTTARRTAAAFPVPCMAMCSSTSRSAGLLQRRHVAMATALPSASPSTKTPSSAVPFSASSDELETCLLCDVSFSSWGDHSLEAEHMARTAVCKYFVLPEANEGLMDHLERHIALDLKEVDALAMRKVERRRRRLLAGLIHLVEENVLRDSLPGVSPPTVTQEAQGRHNGHAGFAGVPQVSAQPFLTRLLLGEGYMRQEVIDRTARLVPTLTGAELNAVTTFLMSTRQLARIFDELSLHEVIDAYTKKIAAAAHNKMQRQEGESEGNAVDLLGGVRDVHHGDTCSGGLHTSDGRADNGGASVKGAGEGVAQPEPSALSSTKESAPASKEALSSSSQGVFNASPPSPAWKLSRDAKACIFLACIGELEHFHRQDRPRAVLSKLAADALVLNVVATHARDNLVSELLHEALQRIVEEGSPVWRQHQHQVQQRFAAHSMCKGAANGQNPAHLSRAETKTGKRSNLTEGVDPLTFAYVRNAPLSTTPHSADANSSSTTLPSLDMAAAQQLISSYVAFQDVDGGSDCGGTATTAGATGQANLVMEPIYISAGHFAAKHWVPMEKELNGHVQLYRRLPLGRLYPRLRTNNEDAQY
ncbi:RNA editing complex protein MP46 mitochondrial [Leptomonas seymouri]|uniref:RNA editing complex protein MP46 mitochondrial n=1 Tax=Leptomonas seymouri TaxID=5684 RepID=A0A0N1I7J1_LEPSE|nr:RNA editing complex protein MP46 mitochondrial [Leptomonas seymouri]|eukprot:KPI89492.1 RNA editing complex protein MP46 mitochondrial [Leptomonas seymouri]